MVDAQESAAFHETNRRSGSAADEVGAVGTELVDSAVRASHRDEGPVAFTFRRRAEPDDHPFDRLGRTSGLARAVTRHRCRHSHKAEDEQKHHALSTQQPPPIGRP
jgi:hypothetical protein